MQNGQVFSLGQTGASGGLEHLLGKLVAFDDLDRSVAGQVLTDTSDMRIVARWVKNESGGALTPGTIVKWDTGATYGPGRAAGAAAGATDAGAGVVDPYLLSAGVADNDHFYLIHTGPCKFKFTTGTALTPGLVLLLGASGRAAKFTIGTSDAVYRIGRSLATVASGTANDTLFRGYADFRF